LSRSDKPSEIRPGLATSREIDHDDRQRWIVHLRRGVKWHDGSDLCTPGTGPYKFDKVSQQRLELVPNQDYWEQDRVPKQDRLVLIPMPEGSTRTTASLSGQVDWIEAHSPDAITRLKV
jgi:ABC-type transport system substrate-binding protein